MQFCICVHNKSVMMNQIQENNDRSVIQFPVDKGNLNYKSFIVLLDVNHHDRLITHTNAKLYFSSSIIVPPGQRYVVILRFSQLDSSHLLKN